MVVHTRVACANHYTSAQRCRRYRKCLRFQLWLRDPVLNSISGWPITVWKNLQGERHHKGAAKQFACGNRFQQTEVCRSPRSNKDVVSILAKGWYLLKGETNNNEG